MKKEHIQKIKEQYLTMIDKKNFDHFINPDIIRLDDGLAEVRWLPQPEHLNRFGAIHGGALAGLIDTVASIASLTKLKRIVTIELNVSYIKAATISTKVLAKGVVIQAGKSLIRTTVELFNEDNQLITRGNLTFFILGELIL
jgi:acyl-coenzyme A thioesterase 13